MSREPLPPSGVFKEGIPDRITIVETDSCSEGHGDTSHLEYLLMIKGQGWKETDEKVEWEVS
jgi:hypothetical protein